MSQDKDIPKKGNELRESLTREGAAVPPTFSTPVTPEMETLWRETIPPDTDPGTSLRPENPIAPRGTGPEVPLKKRVLIQPVPRSPNAPAPGIASGDFEVITKLGAGGMGVIFEARQSALDRVVAIKTLHPNHGASTNSRQRLATEASLIGDLDHPNIVPVYDLGLSERGDVFYAMKRVFGVTWADVLKEQSLERNLDILLRVSDAVAFAHFRGVIHRDLKPDNVMLGDFNEVLLMDWGLAASVSASAADEAVPAKPPAAEDDPERTITSRSAPASKSHGGKARPVAAAGPEGTIVYMSPEMARAEKSRIGTCSDIYLLGGILYEIVTGLRPHDGKNIYECLANAAKNIIQPSAIKNELVDIALKAMSTNPADRYPTVQAFQQAVRDYLVHSQSLLLCDKAQETLEEARVKKEYSALARSVSGFEQALVLWPHNTRAQAGRLAGQLEYARIAGERDDLELALSLLSPQEPSHQATLANIREAMAHREARRHRLRLLNRAVIAAGVMIVLGAIAMIGLGIVAMQQKKLAIKHAMEADEQRHEAVAAHEATEKARTSLEQQAYFMRIALADRAIKAANFPQVKRLLEECPPSLRGWEWKRLENLRHLDLATWNPKNARSIRCVKYSHDGSKIAASCGKLGIVIMDSTTGQELLWLFGHTTSINGIDFSFDDKRLVSVSEDGSTRLWDTQTGTQLRKWNGVGSSVRVIFFPDGQRVASVSTRQSAVRIWNVDAKDDAPPSMTLTNRLSWGIAISPDSKLLAGGGAEGHIFIWDAQSGQLLKTLEGHTKSVHGLEFSHDGLKLASTSADNTARVWDLQTNSQISLCQGHSDLLWTVNFTPDDFRMVTSSKDGTVRLWDVATGGELHNFHGHTGQVMAAAISPDGSRIISGDTRGAIKLWNIDAQPPDLVLRGHSRAIRGMAISADSATAYSGAVDGTIKSWDLQTGASIKTLSTTANALAISPDGKILANQAEQQVKLWNTKDGSPLRTMQTAATYYYSLAFSPDGQWLVALGVTGEIEVWNLTKPEVSRQWKVGSSGVPVTVVFSKDSRWFAVCDEFLVSFWDPATGKRVRNLFESAQPATTSPAAMLDLRPPIPTSLAITPDGKQIAIGYWSGELEWWNLDAGTRSELLTEAHGGGILTTAFSHDGRRLITAGTDRVVKLWDVETHREILSFEGNTGQVSQAMFTPDDRRIVSCSEDGTMRVWDRGPLDNPSAAPSTQPSR